MFLDQIVTAPLERKIATLETCVARLEARVAELEEKNTKLIDLCGRMGGQLIAAVDDMYYSDPDTPFLIGELRNMYKIGELHRELREIRIGGLK